MICTEWFSRFTKNTARNRIDDVLRRGKGECDAAEILSVDQGSIRFIFFDCFLNLEYTLSTIILNLDILVVLSFFHGRDGG